nr:hypothetical protein [Streptosporangium nondiastaticum]
MAKGRHLAAGLAVGRDRLPADRAGRRRRHGVATRRLPVGLAYECLFRRGILFFLDQDGARVAGVLCARPRDGRVLTMRLLGVLDGARRYYTGGVVDVIPFAVELAQLRVRLGAHLPRDHFAPAQDLVGEDSAPVPLRSRRISGFGSHRGGIDTMMGA